MADEEQGRKDRREIDDSEWVPNLYSTLGVCELLLYLPR